MWNEIILRHGVTPWWNQIWLCQPCVHLCFWLSTHSLLSLSPPSHFRNNVSYSFMYQNLINTLTQVNNTWYKCESDHTNHIFDTDTNERLGSLKKKPPKVQMSTNEHKQIQTSMNRSQMSTNKHKQNRTSTNERKQKPNKNGDQQTDGDEQRRAHWGQPSGDKWGPETSDTEDERRRGQTRGSEHERGLPKLTAGRARTSAKALGGNNITSRDGQQVVAWMAVVVAGAAAAAYYLVPLLPPFPPFFILFFVVSHVYYYVF